MKTERVFLMELFLDDELPKKIKIMIKDRFQELETPIIQHERNQPTNLWENRTSDPAAGLGIQGQSPSMQRIMASNTDLIPAPRLPTPTTPAAAQALAQRQSMIDDAINGKDKHKASRKM